MAVFLALDKKMLLEMILWYFPEKTFKARLWLIHPLPPASAIMEAVRGSLPPPAFLNQNEVEQNPRMTISGHTA